MTKAISKSRRHNQKRVVKKEKRVVKKEKRVVKKEKRGGVVSLPSFLSKALKKGRKVAKKALNANEDQAVSIATSVVKDLFDTRAPVPAVKVKVKDNTNVNYAEFASAAYMKEGKIPKRIAPGYVLVKYWPRASAYVNHAKKEVVFSSRGTDTSDPGDIVTDAWIVKSEERKAPEYADLKKQFNVVAGMFPGYSIVLTGHSKGGRLVIDLGEDFPNKGIKKVYTFAPGSSIGHKVKYRDNASYRIYINSKVVTRRVKGDPISVLAENAFRVKNKPNTNPHSSKF